MQPSARRFPVLRRLGMPAYQLAVVVDDAHQGVSEIVRGADLLESCARQWLLQEALGFEHPRWWHVPLVTDALGRRLAKRSDDCRSPDYAAPARIRGKSSHGLPAA